MIKLGDLIQEIKTIPARSGLVYWPELRNNLRKEFKRGYKIYNNLSESYPSIKISFSLPGAAEPISDIDPKDVYNYLTSFNARNWKFDLKKDAYGKDTIYAYPLDIPRGNEKIGFSHREDQLAINSYLSRLKDLGINYVDKDTAFNSWIKHFPQGNLQEIKSIPAYSKVDIVKTLQKPENIKLLKRFIKDYFIDNYGIDEYRDYYYLDVYEVKPENIKNINNVAYLASIKDTRKYQNLFYDTDNIAYINFESFPYSIFTFESNANFDYLRPLDYEYLNIREGDDFIIAINFDTFN